MLKRENTLTCICGMYCFLEVGNYSICLQNSSKGSPNYDSASSAKVDRFSYSKIKGQRNLALQLVFPFALFKC